jgi:nitrogen regulatory protein PII
MKEVRAYIKKRKVEDVIHALRKVDGLTGMTILDVRGLGVDWATGSVDPDLHTTVKVEIICLDDLVSEVIKTIEKTAHTGLQGDGKIYVSNIEHAVRISTGVWGDEAV